MVKKRVNWSISEIVIEAIKVRASRPVATGFDAEGKPIVTTPNEDDVKVSISSEIERAISHNLKQELRNSVFPALLEQCRTPDDICSVYIAIQKARTDKGKVEGYKLLTDKKSGLIRSVLAPDEAGNTVLLPVRDLSKKSERPYDALDVDQLIALSQIEQVPDKD